MNKKYLINLGLAFTLIYAGVSSFLYPTDWVGFVPVWVEKFGTSQMLALQMHATAELILGAWLLSNWKVKWAGAVVALDMAAILLVNGFDKSIFLVTFRDVGLLLAAIYLAVADE